MSPNIPDTIIFDVNETLLDLGALAPQFEKAFGDARMLREWFYQVIGYAKALTIADAYKPFGDVALATLQMMAEAQEIDLPVEEAKSIAGGIRRLPPHPEVPEALARLKRAGFRMFTLTNSPMAAVDAQMAHAGLEQFFECNFSVDTVRRYKPDREPYLMVARELEVAPGDLLMIAAHAWDVGGAAEAGLKTGFVARGGHAPFPLFRKPDFTGRNLNELADAIIAARDRATVRHGRP